jgi:hypothetical protein
MKILALFLVVLSLSSFAFTKKNLSGKSFLIEGSNFSNEASTESVAYGFASNKGFILQSTAVIF